MALQGISSASNSSHAVPSSANSPAACAAPASLLTTAASSSGPRNGRPVLVHSAPGWPSSVPNRSAAAPADAQISATAREPMCFSSQITCSTPSRR